MATPLPQPETTPPGRNQDDVLSGIGEVLGRCEDLPQLYRALYHETSRILDATGFILGLYDEAVQTVTVVHQVDSGVELPGGSFPLGNGFTSQVIRTRQPLLIRNWAREGPHVRIQYATNQQGLPESGITAPLFMGPRVTGVLSVQSYTPDAYDTTDLLKLQIISGHAAVAIEHLQRSVSQDDQLPKRISELETILASMSEALLIVDSRGCITQLNHAARRLLCPDSGSGGIVLGQPLDREQWGQWPLGPRAVAEALSPLIRALRRGETLRDLEIEILGSGRQVLSFSCAPLRDSAGGNAGGVIVFRDVTDRRDIERIKDEALSIASHELKTPVTIIKGHAQMLQAQIARGRATPESTEKGLSSIVKSSDHLVELLDLLLDLSRIEAGRLDLQRTPADMVSVMSAVGERVLGVTSRHQLLVEAPEVVDGAWDTRRLGQLFQNLLSNAVKYSPEGGTIHLSIEADAKQVTVCVSDEGVGIRQDELPRLFDRFYRAEEVRRLEGSGLGLYICQGIVSAHGGRIWADSEGEGKGSAFSFTLPRWPSRRHVMTPGDQSLERGE